MLKFSDLDYDLQKSVFAATSIVALLLCLCLITIVHYILIGLTVAMTMYLGYVLFLKPVLNKKSQKTRSNEARKELADLVK